MSKLFAIHAFEDRYQGMHGIEDHAVVECIDEKEAEDYAEEMAYSVIDSYSHLFEEEEYEDEVIEHGIEYNIWEIKPTTISLEELNDLFYNDPEGFVEKYCLEN